MLVVKNYFYRSVVMKSSVTKQLPPAKEQDWFLFFSYHMQWCVFNYCSSEPVVVEHTSLVVRQYFK